MFSNIGHDAVVMTSSGRRDDGPGRSSDPILGVALTTGRLLVAIAAVHESAGGRPGFVSARSPSEDRAIAAVAPRRRLPEQARRLIPPRKPSRRFFGPVILAGFVVGCVIALLIPQATPPPPAEVPRAVPEAATAQGATGQAQAVPVQEVQSAPRAVRADADPAVVNPMRLREAVFAPFRSVTRPVRDRRQGPGDRPERPPERPLSRSRPPASTSCRSCTRCSSSATSTSSRSQRGDDHRAGRRLDGPRVAALADRHADHHRHRARTDGDAQRQLRRLHAGQEGRQPGASTTT